MLNPQYIGNQNFEIIANEPETPLDRAVTSLIGPDTAANGEQIELVFGLSGAEGITAQDISISYDNSKLEFVEVVPVINGTTVSESAYYPEEGTIRLILASNAISGNADVVRLKFNAKGSGTGVISVTKAELGNGDGDVISAELSNKTITIEAKNPDDADKTALLAAIASTKEVQNNTVEGIETGISGWN